MKEKYYVDLRTHAITQNASDVGDSLAVYADEQELSQIRTKLDTMHNASNESHLRSLVTILRYSYDPQNEEYDQKLREVFQLLYQLGDEETREHVGQLIPDINHKPKL